MEAGLFSILRLRPGRYSPEAIDRQYRSVRQGILRDGGPDRQRRLDEAMIARALLRLPNHQASLLRRSRPTPVRRSAAPSDAGRMSVSVVRRAPAAEPAPPADPDVYARFARMVPDHLDAGVLRFSARRRLMLLAAGLGIGEFKANLIIAEVLHDLQCGIRPPGRGVMSRPPHASAAPAADRPALGRSLALAAALALVADAAIAMWLFL